MMRFFQISLLFVFLTSCSPIVTNYSLQKKSILEVKNNYFSDVRKDYIYKAKIDIYGNYIGGILIIKPLAKNHHRIVFTTEFGAKMFDIELKNNELIKNKVVKKLDRKFIINTLKKDFEVLLQAKATVLNTYRFDKNTIYQTKKGKRFNFCFYNAQNELFKITNTTKYKEKVVFLFSNFKNKNPQNIDIKHRNIKLTINLQSLK